MIRNRLHGEIEGVSFPGLENFLLVPVAKDDLHVGWLVALNRISVPERRLACGEYPTWGLSDEEFGTVESGLMLAAASMLVTHARNVQLLQEKESLFLGALRSLINAMDAKDPYTCGHSDRVALIARRLGEELGLSARERNALYISGLAPRYREDRRARCGPAQAGKTHGRGTASDSDGTRRAGMPS